MGSKLALACLSLCLGVAGCSGTANRQPIASVTVETASDLAFQDVIASPTDFVVRFPEANYSWERALHFFHNGVLDGSGKSYPIKDLLTVEKNQSGENKALLTNRGLLEGRFVYDVQKTWVRGGYKYRVMCTPRTDPKLASVAMRNAQNLSRFIRDGTLERSLLEY